MSTNDLPILCYHGSPGTPDDFAELAKELSDQRLVPLQRAGYPDDGGASAPAGPAIYCGYSWGTVPCIREALANEAAGGVILIAPYLFPTGAGLLKKAVLGTPLLGKALLKKKGPQIVEELLVKSVHPAEVPASYRALAPRLSQPEALRCAVLEKEKPGVDVLAALRALAGREVPLALLWGAQDQSAAEAQQVAPVREAVAGLFERRLEPAGHALLWTHPRELAAAIGEFLGRTD